MKELIETLSFKLAIYIKGDQSAGKLALLVPGRLDTKDYANFVSHADYLASRGYFAVAFDPPGTWDSPGDISLYTTTNYIKAIHELIEYFGNKPTLLLGHSRGAAVSILVSMKNAIIEGIVLVMANYGVPTQPKAESVEKGFELSYRDLPPGTHETKEQKEFVLPMAYWEDGKRYNVTEELKKCTKPKLLIYGDQDEFTPIEVVKKLFEEIPEPKVIKRLHCTHDYRYFPEVIEEVNKIVGDFIIKYK